ncbi:MAG: glycosyltransferase family 2 protein, partial [Bacteroidota bacterium]
MEHEQPTLSILVPAYNEERTIYSLLERLAQVTLVGGVKKQIIVVNDASADGTESVIFRFKNDHPDLDLVYAAHEKNKGKGAALHTGISSATGDFIVVQDADLEYDPEEFNLLLQPLLNDRADVVYGSRFMGGKTHRILFFWHSIGNKFLTFLSNMFTNL